MSCHEIVGKKSDVMLRHFNATVIINERTNAQLLPKLFTTN